MKVIFSHGKESGPWGSKIKRLAATAEQLVFSVDSIDYTGIVCPDERVEKLTAYLANETEPFVLVGSSMGGYVSLIAAEKYLPAGVFLLAPALYMSEYLRQDYRYNFNNLTILHGWSDDVISYKNSVKYCERAKCTLHLVNGDHRLNDSIETVDDLFSSFLHQCLKL